ncbi:(2Fe-2S)-binding protein [Microbacterium protaetiae]|uniref:(2Fe-2S)-binding protein n=1 Tax=Microbacterium protaetiae TaxID=2509458 RepID=A0A4P6EPV2_9MICO|nr:Rieske 2Fe-2S domain-containing protein [Microbacterium protaetiae]QAY59988.1 (2Fe-2S)-binding protein [Microbacterium protaetiae]
MNRVLKKLESARDLDRITLPLSGFVNRLIPVGKVRDLLHGVPLGHPLHPMLVQVPVGAWLSAVVLDRMPGTGRSATVLIGLGTAAAVPAAASGILDWAKAHESQMRVGVVHWAANAVAVGCFAASFVQRVRGRTAAGKRLALAGLSAATIGGYLGGHLAYRQALGANHVEDIPHVLAEGWHAVAALDELPDEALTRRVVDAVPVLLYREGEKVTALADRCSHLSGPLHEGALDDNPEKGMCVVCPWHGSTFSLQDGSVVHGPATSPQLRFRTRISEGQVEISLAA